MADELNRQEVSDRLVTIFSASLEGSELEKAIASVDKRLDKFEGKWAGLIKWAEQKYGLPEESGAEEVVDETHEANGAKSQPEIPEEPVEEISEEESIDVEIITHYKKEYYIVTGENPQYIYQIDGDGGIGDKIGEVQGKKKVFYDSPKK